MHMQQAQKRPSSSRVAALAPQLSSPDGRIAFLVAPAAIGLYLERIENLPSGGAIVHCMRVESCDDFTRHVETDDMRYEYPFLYHRVLNLIEGLFDARN